MTEIIGIRFRQLCDAATEQWLGLSFPPVAAAIEQANWSPDDDSAYCHRCGDSIGPGESTESGCTTCREGAELAGGIADYVVRLGPYVDYLQQWVRSVKYARWVEMGEELGRLLGCAMLETKHVDPARTIVVPMPMPWPRQWYRGIDHSRIIASGVARVLHAPVARVLCKAMQPTQVSMIPSARKRAGGRGLRIRRRLGGWPLDGLHVVLVDDVRTTGATLKAAVRLIRSLNPDKVFCAVAAVSDNRARRDRTVARQSALGVQSPS